MVKEDAILRGLIKASLLREALASCQIEGIGRDITLKDLYLEELKRKKQSLKQLRKLK